MLGRSKVEAVLADLDSAPIEEPLRAMLRFLRHVTRSEVTAEHAAALRASGVTEVQTEEALAVCFAFNVITRLADAFRFDIPPAAAFNASAKMLLSRGYKM